MKLTLDTTTNKVIGTIEGVEETLPNIVYMDIPAGFDMERLGYYWLKDGVIEIDPDADAKRPSVNG